MTPEELETKTETLIQEYLSAEDVNEAITCVKELNAPHYHPDLISKAISIGFEKKDVDRELLSNFISKLVQKDVVKSEDLSKGYVISHSSSTYYIHFAHIFFPYSYIYIYIYIFE